MSWENYTFHIWDYWDFPQSVLYKTWHLWKCHWPNHIFFWLKSRIYGLVLLILTQNVANRDWLYSLVYSQKANKSPDKIYEATARKHQESQQHGESDPEETEQQGSLQLTNWLPEFLSVGVLGGQEEGTPQGSTPEVGEGSQLFFRWALLSCVVILSCVEPPKGIMSSNPRVFSESDVVANAYNLNT